MILLSNEILTIIFAASFIFALTGLIFRLISNKAPSSKDYTQNDPDFHSSGQDKIHILDFARFFRGELAAQDIAALIVSWAENGYILIKSREINKGNNEISAAKLKNLPEDTRPFEKAIFSEIFQNPDQKTISPIKFDNPLLSEKAQKIQESTKWVKFNIHNSEFNKSFSKLFEDIKKIQEKSMQDSSRATCRKFTFLEFFITGASLIMLCSAGLFFMDSSKNDPMESYVMGGLGILCAVFLFAGLYSSGKKWSFKTLLAAAGISYLIFLAGTAYQTSYLETGNLFLENSHKYAGFIFGSILAFLAPKAKSLTPFGKKIKQSLKSQKNDLCQNIPDSDTFFRFLPSLIIFDCVEKAGKNISITKPDWYQGRENMTEFDFEIFTEDIKSLGSALRNLALKKQH
jgi:hypothetical protein